MKKIVLLALILAAVTASAQAITLPQSGPTYTCYYFQNGYFIGVGTSRLAVSGSWTLQRGIEYFQDPGMSFVDNRKVTFAWKSDHPGYSIWEFTINPSGPQCKKAFVYPNAIYYTECGTAPERDCYLP